MTAAQGVSSVNRGGVAAWGLSLPALAGAPGLGVGIGKGWHARTPARPLWCVSTVRKQRDPRVSRAQGCGVLGVAKSMAPALLCGEARGQMAQAGAQGGVCA